MNDTEILDWLEKNGGLITGVHCERKPWWNIRHWGADHPDNEVTANSLRELVRKAQG